MKIPPKVLALAAGVATGVVAKFFVWPKVSAWWHTKGVDDAIDATAAERENLDEDDLGSAAAHSADEDPDQAEEDVAGSSTIEEIEESAVDESDDYFDQAFALTLNHEADPRSLKQWPDHPEADYHVTPGDRGGPTNWGIIQSTYDKWSDNHGLARKSIQEITADEVRAIYHDEFWVKSGAAAVGWPLNAALYDFAVNSGPKNAIRELQKIIGFTGKDVDGGWGPVTALAANSGDPQFLAMMLIDAREQFFHNIVARDASQQKFLKGWLKRLQQLRAELA